MPVPQPFGIVAIAVIVVVPLLILVWYARMYSKLGKESVTGGGLGT